MESDDQTFLCDIMFNIFDENHDQSKSELKVECFITKDEVIVIRNIQCFRLVRNLENKNNKDFISE